MDTMWKQLCALTVTNSVFIHLHPLYAIDCTDETKKTDKLRIVANASSLHVCVCVFVWPLANANLQETTPQVSLCASTLR